MSPGCWRRTSARSLRGPLMTPDDAAYTQARQLYNAYVNMMMDEGQERVQASYRDNDARLVEIKAIYDPHNLFRVNQNIRPADAKQVNQ